MSLQPRPLDPCLSISTRPAEPTALAVHVFHSECPFLLEWRPISLWSPAQSLIGEILISHLLPGSCIFTCPSGSLLFLSTLLCAHAADLHEGPGAPWASDFQLGLASGGTSRNSKDQRKERVWGLWHCHPCFLPAGLATPSGICHSFSWQLSFRGRWPQPMVPTALVHTFVNHHFVKPSSNDLFSF